MTQHLKILLPFALFALAACSDKSEDDTAAADDSSATDDSAAPGGFTISGTAKNLLTGAAATEGLCVDVADPTAALGGGEIEIIASSTVGAGGAYTVEHIETTSVVGLLNIVQDCAGSGPTVLPTATGIKEDIAGLGDGDVVSDYTIFSIDAEA